MACVGMNAKAERPVRIHIVGASEDVSVWVNGVAELFPEISVSSNGFAGLRRCDAVLVTGDWKESVGARASVCIAHMLCKPVLESEYCLSVYLAKRGVRKRGVSRDTWRPGRGL